MCRADYADPATVLHKSTRRARKEHKCAECHRIIGIGEIYLNEGTLFQGSKSTWKTCAHCQVARDWLSRECGGHVWGAVEEDVRDHWVDDGIRSRELALLIWGMGRCWRKRNGELMPIPSITRVAMV